MESASHFAYFKLPQPASHSSASCPSCKQAFLPTRQSIVLVCSHTICTICARQNLSGEFIRCAICPVSSPAALLQSPHVPNPLPAVEEEEPPTNVFEVMLYTLANDSLVATGEPVCCQSCGAVLNSYSQVQKQGENTIWVCEFCKTANPVNIEEGQMPQANEIIYALDPGMQVEEEKKEVAGSDDSSSLIFCLDISGSMGTTERKAQSLRSSKKDPMQQATRLDCVRLAVQSQLESLSRASPASHVGLITFNNEVQVIGDGTVTGCQLSAAGRMTTDQIRAEMDHKHKVMMSNPVAATKEALSYKLNALKPRGGTALGPGLVAGIELAVQAERGSKVIICTDGLANQGVGKIEGELADVAQTFYNEIGSYAQQKGVSVSVISIASGDCKLAYLSYVADLTEGSVLKVDPANLTNDFSNILAEKIIATEVSAVVILHKALKFKNESEDSLQLGGSKLRKLIGNVTQMSEFTFEYSMKNSEELAVEELENLKQVPFQLLLEFKNKKGQRMLKCCTKMLQATTQAEEAKREVNVGVVAANFEKQGARMVKEGRYNEYKSHNVKAQRWAAANQAPEVQQMQMDWQVLDDAVRVQESLEMQQGMNLREEGMAKPQLQQARRANMSDHVSALVNKISKKRS